MNEIIRLKITFNFNYIENVDEVLKKYQIIHKSFNNGVSYVFELNEQIVNSVIYYLMLATSKQIKIENISSLKNKNEDVEIGTDKPIGSKDAIDEN